jgi:hypothetical protein
MPVAHSPALLHIGYFGKRVPPIVEVLYSGATEYLQRKFVRAEEVLSGHA